MEQISQLASTGITIETTHFNLEFVFCSDWKFLALLIGIKNANSTWFCPWCLCSKHYRQLLELSWEEFLRKWEKDGKCLDCVNLGHKCPDSAHGRNPTCACLLTAPFTPESCILDNLHGELRTSEVMERALFHVVDEKNLQKKLEKMCQATGKR
jgi:hypothetical protein